VAGNGAAAWLRLPLLLLLLALAEEAKEEEGMERTRLSAVVKARCGAAGATRRPVSARGRDDTGEA
jgi:hypothetical protein